MLPPSLVAMTIYTTAWLHKQTTSHNYESPDHAIDLEFTLVFILVSCSNASQTFMVISFCFKVC